MEAYLDNAATTRPSTAAAEEALHLMRECWGNPSSGHRLGTEAAAALRLARRRAARALGAPEDRVFFTSGGTEADNWAVFGAMARMGKRGRHIITTAVEHHAVLEPIRELERRGYEVTRLMPDGEGRISLADFTEALRPDTVFCSVMMVNNESGAIMPIREMASALHRRNPDALFHTDAVQGLGKVAFRASSLGADLISVSAHKIHGIKGAGALYIRKDLPLPPFVYGGGQESGFRSGTEALPAIGAFGAACEALEPSTDIPRMAALRDLCLEQLTGRVPDLVTVGAHDAPHILTVSLPGARSQGILNLLQEQGVAVSAGSACSKGHRSHVLEAMGLPAAVIDGAVRISLCRETTPEEIELLVTAMEQTAHRLLSR